MKLTAQHLSARLVYGAEPFADFLAAFGIGSEMLACERVLVPRAVRTWWRGTCVGPGLHASRGLHRIQFIHGVFKPIEHSPFLVVQVVQQVSCSLGLVCLNQHRVDLGRHRGGLPARHDHRLHWWHPEDEGLHDFRKLQCAVDEEGRRGRQAAGHPARGLRGRLGLGGFGRWHGARFR